VLVSELSTDDRELMATDERHRQLVRALGVTSYMIVPLITAGTALGAVTLAMTTSGRRFGPGDLALAEDLAARVAQVVAKERRYEEEHELAHTLQTSLLPTRLPVVEGLHVAVRYLPGTRGADVGGDWYDMVELADDRVGVAVGDVAGHNIAAASAMGRIRSATRALARHATGPAGLLDLLQDSWRLLDVDRLTTLVLAHVDVATGDLRIASAGHPPPLLARASGSAYLPVEAAPPLGAPRRPVVEYVTRLEPGETLLLYTDGLIETRHGGVEGGMVGVAERAASGSLDPSALCDRLIEAFPRGPERADDVAMLALSRTSPTGGTTGGTTRK
jgi:serine phosphatase RsbU (regulator of sigma subunit)